MSKEKTEEWKKYRSLEGRLCVLRDIPEFNDSQDEDDILDQMHDLWWEMTSAECVRLERDHLRDLWLEPQEQGIGIDGFE